MEDILGLSSSVAEGGKSAESLEGVMEILLEIRAKAKANKDFATSDMIRDKLKAVGIAVMDGKDGASWKQE